MTFTVLGHCEVTGRTGIAITSLTLGVGGVSPFYTYAGDIVVVQAKNNTHTAIGIARLLDGGATFAEIGRQLAVLDRHASYRQIGVMRRDGRPWAWTGEDCIPWRGHRVGADFVAMGNVLSGSAVVDAMAAAFADTVGQELPDRLLTALEAGRDAGGQGGSDGTPFSERGAALKIFGMPDIPESPLIDLRVDIHPEAVAELRRLYTIYQPMAEFRILRASRPADAPSTLDWERIHMTRNPPPSPIRARR